MLFYTEQKYERNGNMVGEKVCFTTFYQCLKKASYQ